jgi:hypothetical protein
MTECDELISGNNIAKKCDFVFSQTISPNGTPVPYIANTFPSFCGGELLFCKTDFLDVLNVCLDRMIDPKIPLTIVTHDSDFSLTDSIIDRFGSRPISWWGMNCETAKANPLPIGIANSYCKKTLKSFEQSINPSMLLYVNHRSETFPTEREWLYDHFSSAKWTTVRKPYNSGDVELYKKELLDHKFVLCPRGNGVDTHRIWEALYCGVVPVVIRHRTHSMLEGKLPILFVDNYMEVNQYMLENAYDEFKQKKWNMDMLKVSWWISQMKEKSNAS